MAGSISRWGSMVIDMHCEANEPHHFPHIHVRYNEHISVFHINGTLIEGSGIVENTKDFMLWMTIHHEELTIAWDACERGERPNKIEPLPDPKVRRRYFKKVLKERGDP